MTPIADELTKLDGKDGGLKDQVEIIQNAVELSKLEPKEQKNDPRYNHNQVYKSKVRHKA